MLFVNEQKVNTDHFPDGTFLAKLRTPKGSIGITWLYDSDEELVHLIYLTKHFREHGASRINLFMPYIPNARQDRVKTDEDIFTLKYFADVINWLQFDVVVVSDPHSPVAEAMFDRIYIDRPDVAIMRVYNSLFHSFGCDKEKTTLFFPDEGAMKRYAEIAKFLDCEFTFGIKNRDWKTGTIQGLDVSGDVENNVNGCDILIIDDICSKGGTFYHSAQKLKELGAKRIFLYVTHCENTIAYGHILTTDLIDHVFTTQTICSVHHPKITYVDPTKEM